MKSAALALASWAAAVFLAVLIAPSAGQASAADPLSRILGSAEEAVGDTLFLKADVYFHGGVLEEMHQDETAEELRREGAIPGEAHGDAPKDWIESINRRVGVYEVKHITRDERKEMLPFFAMATALDPRNIEAVLTTAYWLENEFAKPAEARAVLEKGLADNPGSWEIENALGHFYLRQKETEKAAAHLDAAAKGSVSAAIEAHQRLELHYQLAEARYSLGDRKGALSSYEEAARFFDGTTAPYLRSRVEERIKELSATG